MFGEWEVSATRPLRRGEILRCSDEIENERNHGNIPPQNSCRVRKRESRRKPEWKRKRNEDGSEWNRDMRFRLWLGAMNIPMGEAARPAKKTGSVWLEYSVRGHKQKQVRSLGMSSRCLDPAANRAGTFASSNTTCSLPPPTPPEPTPPSVLHNVGAHPTFE